MLFAGAVGLQLFAALLLLSNSLSAGDWPQWRGPQRNGHAPADTPFVADGKFFEKWRAEVGTGFSSFACTNGRVFTVGNADDQDTLWCLNVTDGSVLWKHTYPAPLDPNLFEGGPTSTPTVTGERVYVISRTGDIFCLNAADGSIVWHVLLSEEQRQNRPSWGYAGSPLVDDGKVYFNVGSHGLCLNAENGETIWESDNSELPGYTSPFFVETSGARLMLLESEKALQAVDPASGDVKWKFPWITRYGINAADPIVLNDHQLIVTSGYQKGGSLLEFTADSCNEKWRTREIRSQMSPGVLIGDQLYAIDGDAGRDPRLICADPATGKIKWFSREVGCGSVIAVGTQAAVLSESGELLILPAGATEFKPLVRSQILEGKCWTPMAYSDEMFFARNADGRVVCIAKNQNDPPPEKTSNSP
ncbi:PQQ-binding-like beta-propeller repeat protein [Planctomicrobium piriforme]|uniref:Outer membrane protein assembly factor BamB, contains PQQ-like beta-propeller repeat n=1 Tax=Planctomicrobium piriforme TaxID=1576369 RepID=A0A1I3F9M3_9PLAN|nr:PQQ-binding-like beta-propeller repeat protein [Planctomicrobium piriforme]SFI07903.1 Outer membrane protein assembly factor BamB, contains PQQ-like beta-propeller repeat [Planctomicrobium piriforme]